MSLLRANVVVASGTTVSRVTGLVRTAVTLAVLGQALLTDVYYLSDSLPNIVYDLLLGGLLSATMVPLFTSYMADRPGGDTNDAMSAEEARRGTNVLISTAITLLVGLTVVAVLAAPLIFRLYTFNVPADVDLNTYRRVGTILTRVFLLEILFYGLTGIGNAYLNSRHRFVAAAWSPVAANVVIIASMASLYRGSGNEWLIGDMLTSPRLRWTLSLGAPIGIATMAIIVIVAVARSGIRYRWELDWSHPVIRKLLRLSGWSIGFVVANQVALFVIRNLLVGLGPGNVAAYQTAFTFFVLPHGLLAVSISTTFQPGLARAVRDDKPTEFARQASLGVRSIAALTLPAAAVMIVMSDDVLTLMQRGSYTAADARQAAPALVGFAIGLAAFSVYQFTLRGFYAHHDSRTPFLLNVGENALNIIIAFVVIGRWGLFGLAASYGAAYIIAAVAALIALKRRVEALDLGDLARSFARLAVATLAMGAAIYAVRSYLPGGTVIAALGALAVGSVLGLIVYVASLLVLRAPEVDLLRRRLGA